MPSSRLRATAGRPIEELAEDDALRIQFNQLHEYSVYVLMAGMIAAALAYFLLAYRSRNTENKEIKTTVKNSTDFKF